MNKHIIGLIIFSFIVGMSAIIAGFFVTLPQIPKIDPVVSNSHEYVYSGKTYCKKKKRRPRPKDSGQLASAKVSQAVFDLSKKRLTSQFMIERANDSTENVNVALHFFVNDRYGVQHIATELVELSPHFDMGDKAITTNSASFKWLSNLESHDNLYIMAEVVNDFDNEKYLPVFDSYEAAAVLLSPKVVAR